MKATGLKRVKGKRDVFRLQQDLQAWNVDGSSTDQLQNTSWIKYWEEMSGFCRSRCAFSDCDRDAEHGGHVWIKGHTTQTGGVWITPICKQCNYCDNPMRQRDAHGQHSTVRKGTVVVRTEYTPDMANAERRVSYPDNDEEYDSDDCDEEDWEAQICEDCGFGLSSGTPKHHTRCAYCYRRNALAESTKTPIARNAIEDAVKRARGRLCEGCGDDISDAPANHYKCLGCFSGRRNSVEGTGKRARGRLCEGCGDDISTRPSSHTRCYDCHRG